MRACTDRTHVYCFVQIAWTAFMSHMASSSNEEGATATKQAQLPRSKQLQQASR